MKYKIIITILFLSSVAFSQQKIVIGGGGGGSSLFTDSGTATYLTDSTDFLGIGTSTPEVGFHLKHDTMTAVNIWVESRDKSALRFYTNDGENGGADNGDGAAMVWDGIKEEFNMNTYDESAGTWDVHYRYNAETKELELNKNLGGKITVGNSIFNAGGQALELNINGSGDRNAYIDFHAEDAVDYNFRILRWAGTNGSAYIEQQGTGDLALYAGGSVAARVNSANAHNVLIGGAGTVAEQFTLLCNGSAVTVGSGTYTAQNVTAEQIITTTYADITGSSITYTPPSGAQMVVFEFTSTMTYKDNNSDLGHFKLFLDGTEVTAARMSKRISGPEADEFRMKWVFYIGGSTDTSIGRLAAWTTGKTIKIQGRDYASAHEFRMHSNQWWDGATATGTDLYRTPTLSITSIY